MTTWHREKGLSERDHTFTDRLRETFIKSVPQTEAVDVWALRVIALLLTNGPCNELNRLNQEAIDDQLAGHFGETEHRMSSNGENFVRGCLNVSPSFRMSVAEAGSHDWLHTPAKHLDFFERFDRRMIADWQLESQLKPIPWELQNFSDAELGNRVEQQPTGAPIEIVSPHPSQEDRVSNASKYLPQRRHSIPADQNRKSLFDRCAKPTLLSPNVPDKAQIIATQSFNSLTESGKQTVYVPNSKKKPNHVCQRKRSKVSKIPDFVFLPLPGLDRHLPRPQSGTKREAVLEALTRTSSKFLKDDLTTSYSRPTPSKPLQRYSKRSIMSRRRKLQSS